MSPMQKLALYKKSRRPQNLRKSESKPVEKVTEKVIPKETKIPVEDYLKMLQEQYNTNVNFIKTNLADEEDYVKVALTEAEQIWLNVQVLMQSEKYAKMTDDERISLIQKDFKEFYKNFPIVSRYMICLGQYKMDAFKRMLKVNKGKESTDEERRDESEERKSANEKAWIKRQADYVRFLWEEHQVDDKGEPLLFNPDDSDKVWQEAHDSLEREFREFRELHEEMEKKVAKDSLKYKKELIYEMSTRIINGQQKLDNSKSYDFINKLKDKLFKQRSKTTIKEINDIVRVLPSTHEGEGINIDAKLEYDDELKQSHYKKTYKKMDINKIMV
jgi:hypothetical protein